MYVQITWLSILIIILVLFSISGILSIVIIQFFIPESYKILNEENIKLNTENARLNSVIDAATALNANLEFKNKDQRSQIDINLQRIQQLEDTLDYHYYGEE